MIDRLLGNKVIGVKQSTKAMKSGKGVKLYLADDADQKIKNTLISLANQKQIIVCHIDTMKELGKMCEIEVGSAAALML